MRPIAKHKWLWIVAVAGFLLTGCGNESDWDSYKAESALGGSNNPTTVTNTVSSPAEMQIGDVYTVVFDGESKAEISFDGVDSASQFVLAVTALDTAASTRTVQMTDENASSDAMANVATTADWKGWSAHEALDQQLRAAELTLAVDPELSVARPTTYAAGAMKAMFSASSSVPQVGDIEYFSVLGGLSSLSTYKSVSAEVKCVGNNIIFYVDSETDTLSNSDIQSLCDEFDTTVDEEYSIFGEPSDVNSDGHIAVLMTPQVNRLGAMGGGIITGFFFANDLYSSANSNQREIIYTMVPDPSGKFGTKIPKDFAMDNLLPAVLPHELQHAINYNLKVFENEIASEENWLNEALSHFSEDRLGYGMENPSRVEVFLSNPSYYGVASAGSPSLAERGAAYLFLRYLYEQADDGDQFIWDLMHSEYAGVENVEMAFNGKDESFDQFSEFMIRWTTAMIMTSFNISTDERFAYAERVQDEQTGNWKGVCLTCDPDDGRGTLLNGVALSTYFGVSQIQVDQTASKFYKIASFPSNIKLDAKQSGTYGATLVRYE